MEATRSVVCGEAVDWINKQDSLDGSVVTSLPDFSEVGMGVKDWEDWFVSTIESILRKVPSDQYVILYQTDVKITALYDVESGEVVSQRPNEGDAATSCSGRGDDAGSDSDNEELHSKKEDGAPSTDVDSVAVGLKDLGMQRGEVEEVVVEYIDKGFLCQLAAHRVEGCRLLWHKIALICPPDFVRESRPTYSHMLCFSRVEQGYDMHCPTVPDVLHRGKTLWTRGIGLDAAEIIIRWLSRRGNVNRVIDPFCGKGTTLAVANLFGLDAVGVDLSEKWSQQARELDLSGKIKVKQRRRARVQSNNQQLQSELPPDQEK